MSDHKEEQIHFPYLPHTKEDRIKMLEAIGVKSFEELIAQIPKDIRISNLSIASGLSELELSQKINQLAQKNKPLSEQISFVGGGVYRRFVPAVVPSIVSRSEFATSYTPYQPEVSQGTLQAIYEFQTVICLLTNMDVANASMYDGPTAAAEACAMATRITQRNKVLVAHNINPEYFSVVKTYTKTCGLAFETIDFSAKEGAIDSNKLNIDESTACVLVQYPNFFGCLEDLDVLAQKVHAAKALLIVACDPISLGLLEAPGSFGADIVVGDAQQCGNNLSFGGPTAGFMACRNQFVRQLPGRLVGVTQDNRGQRAFTLTLQTREQHIRRAKATSNICTNQALNALTMLVYLSLLGPNGLKEVAELSLQSAHYLKEELSRIPNITIYFTKPFFNEFVIETPYEAKQVLTLLREQNILGGLNLDRFYPDNVHFKKCILIATTEMNSKDDIDKYIEVMKQVISNLNGKAHSGNCISPLVSKCL
jgi:glycine dehydrogenase subunit 1